MDEFTGLAAVVLIFGSIPAIIIYIVYSRHKEHLEMMSRGVSPAQFASPPSTKAGNATLLLGLLAVFTGLAFTVCAFLVQKNFDRDLMTAGVIFIFIGAAFLTYWKMTTEDRVRARRIQEEHYKWLLEQSKELPVQSTVDSVVTAEPQE